MSASKFRPARKLESQIPAYSSATNGYIWFATDTGKIYLDTATERILMGSSGISLFYGFEDDVEQDPITDGLYRFPNTEASVKNHSNCRVDDLILNSDGSFYTVTEVSPAYIYAEVRAVSGNGSGSGTGTSTKRGRVSLTNDGEPDILNGDTATVTITVTSMTYDNEPVQVYMPVTITLATKDSVSGTYKNYYSETLTVQHGVPFTYDATSVLRESSETKITCTVTAAENNEFSIPSNEVTITTHALSVEWNTTTFDSAKYFENNSVTISCEITTSVNRILDIYFDDQLILVGKYGKSTNNNPSSVDCTITPNSKILNLDGSDSGSTLVDYFTHGAHTVKAQLSLTTTDGSRGNSTNFITKEIAIKMNDEMPLIWVGDYQDSYYEYDTILLPYRVYEPGTSQYIEVHLSKNGVEIEGSPRSVEAASTTWSYWEISNLQVDSQDYYTIRIGKDEQETKRNFTFNILEDPRHMGVISTPSISFESKGRSNSESKTKRETLVLNNKKATFSNFNWYNNGWVFDSDQTTCLRISNGASISIPVEDKMVFQGGGTQTDKHTIEFQFKIKNVQDYSKLITNYTRYTTGESASVKNWDDSLAFEDFKTDKAAGGYTNYDSFLANSWLPAHPDAPDYDELEYKSTTKTFDFNNVVCYYATSTNGLLSEANSGIYIGPADAFFTNGINSVTVDFIEDELINLAFVFTGGTSKTGGDKLMEIYLNGILTSVARSSADSQWSIDSGEIVFSSGTCDIDLYKIRTYNKALLPNEILLNYAFDLKDTDIWDQKDLGQTNNTLNEYQFSYNKMIEYNEEHPNAPLMPYIILYTTEAKSLNRLPYNKSNEAVVGSMEFVNTALDAAYANGSLSKIAEEAGVTVEDYYIHHCPSWISATDKVSFSVQGTSSQFYPRRNFKAKTKGNMYNNRGPYATLYAETYADDPKKTQCKTFYFDNNTVGTDKFTLKIDYMESSGDYNRGFANLVATTYSKHPIEDYVSVFDNFSEYGDVDDYRTSVQGFPVLAFHKPDDVSEPIFIGKYNMLVDKGSAECYGFKPSSKVTSKALDGAKVKDIVECWEFENNSRGFCSFRDPWNRKELSFKAPTGLTDSEMYTANGAPIVADSFEYRYSSNDDNMDLLYDLASLTETNQKDLVESFVNTVPDKVTVETAIGDDGEEYNTAIINSAGQTVDVVNTKETGRQLLLDLYSNWERAVAWVWSTCTDATIDGLGEVPSIGSYEPISLAEEVYKAGSYYIQNTDGTYSLSSADFDEDKTYYTPSGTVNGVTEYRVIILTNDENYKYKAGSYYIKPDEDEEIFTISDDTFNLSETYYELKENEDAIPSGWDLPSPVTYGGKTYKKDTKEYRQAKFVNELSLHFDTEYLATYFIMTEIFECYDSRGKNAMFASWGPQKIGGDYIWYPIFYDIDTQLGINNTGIPSFEYYVDATEDGTFSTNDSVLWNNFYYYFKGLITDKYKQLMGNQSSNFGSISNPIFARDRNSSKVATVEKWYQSDPDVTGSYAMKGDRPLLAYNLDEYFKYITPTNALAKNTYWGRLTDAGAFAQEDDTYFYALQGDRHLYRQQFLTNRLEYIDSWLTLDNYARGGANRIRSRVSANNPTNTSDKWISGTATNGASGLTVNEPYWEDDDGNGNGTIKKHEFDGEYWITMTPIRNSYVTVGTDAANFPSQKYTGSPIKFETSDLKNGVINSGNYREQLYYIYGLNLMKSLGDLSKLYLQEFELTGTATKMTDLLLGYDGLDENGNNYRNNDVNLWTIPAGAETGEGMPLLKEVNLSNVKFKENNPTFDFSSCEKLENFRDTGSNITQVSFADGVALNTLYLTDETKVLKLTEARLLTDLVDTYVNPVKNKSTSKLEVAEENRGLYIANLTDKDNANATTNITTLNIAGGGLGYNSYVLLEKYYNAAGKNPNVTRKVSLTSVQWSPYSLVEDTESEYDVNSTYYVDNGHFGLEPYTYSTPDDWQLNLNNKVIYLYDPDVSGISLGEDNEPTNITTSELFENLVSTSGMLDLVGGSVPNITGIVYINNDVEMDEGDILSKLLNYYPNLTFFFKNVKKGYSARFIIQLGTTLTLIGSQKISNDNYSDSIFFEQPNYSLSELRDYMPNYNFLGWATDAAGTNMVMSWTKIGPDDGTTQTQKLEVNNWDTLRLEEDKKDYTFYAIFTIKQYVARFYDGNMTDSFDVYVDDGSLLYSPSFAPYLDDSDLALTSTYAHLGWKKMSVNETTTNITSGTPLDFSKGILINSYTRFAPIFKEASVYDNIHEEYFDYAVLNEVSKTCEIGLKSGFTIKGKLTVPTTMNGYSVTQTAIGAFSPYAESDYTKKESSGITHIFWDLENRALKTISSFTCHYMTNLIYFEMPETVTVMGSYSFDYCTNLFSGGFGIATSNSYYVADFLANIVEFGAHAMAYSQGITDLMIGNATTTIGGRAFYQMSARDLTGHKLKTITIGTPDGTGSNLLPSGVPGNNQNAQYFGGNYVDNTNSECCIETVTMYFKNSDTALNLYDNYFWSSANGLPAADKPTSSPVIVKV